MTIELLPFSTPNFVIEKTNDLHEAGKWPLAQVDADELDHLCVGFREEVFRKAKKQDPQVSLFVAAHDLYLGTHASTTLNLEELARLWDRLRDALGIHA